MRAHGVWSAILLVLAAPLIGGQTDPAGVEEGENWTNHTEPHANEAPHTGTHANGWYQGSGLSHGFNQSRGWTTYNVSAEWLIQQGTTQNIRVESTAYIVRCAPPTAHVQWANGSKETIACRILDGFSPDAPGLHLQSSITGQSPDIFADLHVRPDANATLGVMTTGFNPWPGFIVSMLAAVGVVAGAWFGWLYLNELRMSRYLIRRLFEETKGRVPGDWPEHVRRRVIARFVVGGKN